MDLQITREDARSSLTRVGLSASDERLDRLAQGIQTARAAAAALVALEMGYGGPAPYRVPAPTDSRQIHGN